MRGAGRSGGDEPHKNEYKGDTKLGKVLKDTTVSGGGAQLLHPTLESAPVPSFILRADPLQF